MIRTSIELIPVKNLDAKYSPREILSIYYSRLHYKRSITMCKNYMSCLRALY